MSEKATIRSNRHWREPLDFWDLTPKELREVDYYVANRWPELKQRPELAHVKPDINEHGCDMAPYRLSNADLLTAFEIVSENESAAFTRYQGRIVDLGEFSAWGLPFCGAKPDWAGDWQGHLSDSYFSGLVIRWSDDCEQFQIGTYCG